MFVHNQTAIFIQSPQATGGTITLISDNGVPYYLHTFYTSPTTQNFTANVNLAVEYFVVAGGGGGGINGGGGGGGGGIITGSYAAITATVYPVVVGKGGLLNLTGNVALNGDNSSVFGLTATGGGGGGNGSNHTGNIGGSGGGGSRNGGAGASGTSGQGNAGGSGISGSNRAGGGGGGGTNGIAGNNDISPFLGTGGDGLQTTFNGTATYYAAGGGGGYYVAYGAVSAGGLGGGGTGGSNTDFAIGGTPNSGAGGGGTGTKTSTAGHGESGIVMIRYPATVV